MKLSTKTIDAIVREEESLNVLIQTMQLYADSVGSFTRHTDENAAYGAWESATIHTHDAFLATVQAYASIAVARALDTAENQEKCSAADPVAQDEQKIEKEYTENAFHRTAKAYASISLARLADQMDAIDAQETVSCTDQHVQG